MSQQTKSRRKAPKQEATANPTPSEFSLAVARVAVSQISQSVGFRTTKLSALETLTHVAIKYMEAIASASASYASMANRTDTNVLDFTNALHDLQSVQGFKGGSTLHESGFCVLGSSVLTDLSKFIRWNEEIPFARPIPRAEKLDTEKWTPILREMELHVPRWLPPFPELKKSALTRRNGEELWENLLAGNGNGGVIENGESESESESVIENGGGNGKGKGLNLELGVKKKIGRVRFRIGVRAEAAAAEEKAVVRGEGSGVNLSGVCIGGKRVCLNKTGSNFNTS